MSLLYMSVLYSYTLSMYKIEIKTTINYNNNI